MTKAQNYLYPLFRKGGKDGEKAIHYFRNFIDFEYLFNLPRKKFFSNALNWENYGKTGKVIFLRGVMEGALTTDFAVYQTLTDKYQWTEEKGQEFVRFIEKSEYMVDLGDAILGHVIDGIDELYKDYANKNIPIFAIATLVTRRIIGKIKTEDLEKELSKLRAIKWQ